MSNLSVSISLPPLDHISAGLGGGSTKNISAGGGGGSDPIGAGVARLDTEIKDHKKELKGELTDVRNKLDTETEKLREKLNLETGKLNVIDGRMQEISKQIPSLSRQWLMMIVVIVVGIVNGVPIVGSFLSSKMSGVPSSAPPSAVQMAPRQ